MAQYNYRARSKDGKLVKGTLDLASSNQVATRILEMGYYPVDIVPAGKSARRTFKWSRKIPVQEVVVFFRQLATMHDAGLSLIYSLNTLADGTHHRRFKEIIIHIRGDVEGGESLSGAMARHEEAFDEVAVNMVKVGEASGNLADVLTRLSDYGERSEELKTRVRNAMLYPVILCVVALGVVIFSLVVVMPKFAAIFAKMKVPLPLPTRILMWASRVVVEQGWVILAALVVLIILVRIAVKTQRGAWLWDGLWLRFPIFGSIRHKNLTARFARNLGTLVESGVDILYSFEVSERTMPSIQIATALRKTRDTVREGESIAPVLEKQHAFPPLVPRMISVGEETGRLGPMLNRLAVYFELEVEMAIKRLTTLLQPFIIIIMGGAVAFVAAATLLPLFTMIKHIR